MLRVEQTGTYKKKRTGEEEENQEFIRDWKVGMVCLQKTKLN